MSYDVIGNLIVRYGYDPDGLRTWKEDVATGVHIHYVYHNNDVIFEKEIATGKARSYVYGVGKQLARVEGVIGDGSADRYFNHTDHVGTLRAVTDEAGNKVWEGEFDSFGKLLTEELLDEGFEVEYWFAGKKYDADIALWYFNARYYDSTTGRFISKDPIQDGMNWYVYCSNNPVKRIDPLGLNDGDASTFGKLTIKPEFYESEEIPIDIKLQMYSRALASSETTEPGLFELSLIDQYPEYFTTEKPIEPPSITSGGRKLDPVSKVIGNMLLDFTDGAALFMNAGSDAYMQDDDGLVLAPSGRLLYPGEVQKAKIFYFGVTALSIAGGNLNAEDAAAASADDVSRTFSSGTGGTPNITLDQARVAAEKAGIDMRMFKLAYEPGSNYGFISQTGSGALWRAPDGRIVLTLQDAGLTSTQAAVETIAHELNHVRGIFQTGVPTAEAIAEAAAQAAGQFIK